MLVRAYRMYFEARTSLADMWAGNPVLTIVLFGLPLGFLSLILYSICCADILDADDDTESKSPSTLSPLFAYITRFTTLIAFSSVHKVFNYTVYLWPAVYLLLFLLEVASQMCSKLFNCHKNRSGDKVVTRDKLFIWQYQKHNLTISAAIYD